MAINPLRRQIVLASAALPLAVPRHVVSKSSDQDYVDALRRGNCMVLIRHAQTVPGNRGSARLCV